MALPVNNSADLVASILRRRLAEVPGASPTLGIAPRSTPNPLDSPVNRIADIIANPSVVAGATRQSFLDSLGEAAPNLEVQNRREDDNDTFLGPLMDTIDFISQPFYGIRNMQLNALRGVQGKPSVGAWEAFSSGFSMDPNQRTRSTFTDILIEAGVPEGLTVDLPILGKVTARGTLGLLVDILDPSLPDNKLRLFSRTSRGNKEVNAAIRKASIDAHKALPKDLKDPKKIEEFIQKFIGDADKTMMLRSFSEEAKAGHRALVSLYGVNILPTPFNVKVFEAFAKAADSLGGVPLLGSMTKGLRGRPLKRVMNQFASENQGMRNMRVNEMAEGLVETARRVAKLPQEQRDTIVPLLEGSIGFRRIIAQGMELGKTTPEIVADIRKMYPRFHAKQIREGMSLMEILEETKLKMRDSLDEMTLGELGATGRLPDGVTSGTTYAEFQALKLQATDNIDNIEAIAARGQADFGPLKGHKIGDSVIVKILPEGARSKTVGGRVRILDVLPDGTGVRVEYQSALQGRGIIPGSLTGRPQNFIVRSKGQIEDIRFDDRAITLVANASTLSKRRRSFNLARIKNPETKAAVDQAAKEFDDLAEQYSRLVGIEFLPSFAGPRELGKHATESRRAWANALDIEPVPMQKALALPEMKRAINEELDVATRVSRETFEAQTGTVYRIEGDEWLSDVSDEAGPLLINERTGIVRPLDEMLDADGFLRAEGDAARLSVVPSEELAVKVRKEMGDTIDNADFNPKFRKSAEAQANRFNRAQETIDNKLTKGKIDDRTRMAVEIAQKRQARLNMARPAMLTDVPDKYKPGSPDAYFADERYFNAIKVSRDAGAIDVGVNGAFILRAQDGSIIRGERFPVSKEVDEIVLDLERKLAVVADEELARDILDDIMEVGYYMRVPIDKFARVIERMGPTFSPNTRKRLSTWLSSSGHRSITTMTSEEFARFNQQHKTRFSQLFEAGEKKKLYKEMGDEAPEFSMFFDTEHPAIRTFQRISKSIRAQTNADFVAETAEFFATNSGAKFSVKSATDKQVIDALAARPGHSLYVIKRQLDKTIGKVARTDDEIQSAVQRNAFEPDASMVKVEEGSLKDLRKGKDMNVYVLPDEVVQELESVHRVMSTPNSIKELAKGYRNFMSLYKGFALMAPSYHARNTASNFVTNVVAGIRPNAYGEAMQYTNRKRGVAITGSIIADDGVTVIEKQDMLEQMHRRGILGTGFMGVESAEAIESQFKRPGINPLRQNFFALRANRKVGQSIEDHFRVAHFIDIWKKTGNASAAQRSVNKYLYNYARDLPTWEKWATNVVPFWRWLRNNYPAQIQIAITNPGKLRLLGNAKLAMESDNKEFFPTELMPEYIKKGLGVQLRTRDGKPEFFLLKGFVAVGDLDDVFKWVGGSDETSGLQELVTTGVNSLGPFKMPIESAFNHSTFFGKKIERFEGETGDFLGRRVERKNIQFLRAVRPLNEINKLNPGNIFGDEATGRVQLNQLDRWVNFATGGKLTPVDQVKAWRQAVRERKVRIQQLRGWLNDINLRPTAERNLRSEEIDNLRELIKIENEEVRKLRRPKGTAIPNV